MNSVYDLPDGRKSVIYTEGNRIMLHAFPARRGTSLFALKDDYLSDLTSVSFYGIIYFAYINLQGQVVFDGIGEGEEKVFACQSRLDEMEMQSWSHLNLIAVGGELWLLCKRYEPERKKWGLKALSPFDETKNYEVIERDTNFMYLAGAIGGRQIVWVLAGADLEAYIWEKQHFRLYKDEKQQTMLAEIKEAAGKAEEQRKKEQREKAVLREKLEQENEMLRSRLQKAEKNLRYAKERYDDLAAIAVKLQEACRRWQEAYGGEEKWMI
ncbi:hypothetical protein OCV51_03925 [Faecalicatena acetigenes]|uniref:Uncharacterized protein n=1 Tax=Faecalicatena acetigenes TaxID=2981790 RepID=A0ABT2T965_9FIRM|nr:MULTISPECIES: hypothetical protein [Lachnospiraceae]MCU6746815.1 hypothetical protein [Faecalicatena acetigenes]SCH45741.1 Uncharacterised protein [uncultured Clostridium sp.]